MGCFLGEYAKGFFHGQTPFRQTFIGIANTMVVGVMASLNDAPAEYALTRDAQGNITATRPGIRVIILFARCAGLRHRRGRCCDCCVLALWRSAGGTIVALEINPLIASPNGAWGVDLLLDFRSNIASER